MCDLCFPMLIMNMILDLSFCSDGDIAPFLKLIPVINRAQLVDDAFNLAR